MRSAAEQCDWAQLTTALEQAQSLQALSIEILGILNDDLAFSDAANRVVIAIQRSTGLDAVALRLQHGEDFPYVACHGYAADFQKSEGTLVARSRSGDICRDKDGRPLLECTCGLVLSGKVDPTDPLFTKNGSCYFNQGLESPGFWSADNDPRVNPRNRCFRDGFKSLALIPVRAHQEIVGLLQLNDRRPDRFTLAMVQFMEGLGAGIGLAVTSKQAEEHLRLLEATIDVASDSIYWLDASGRFVFVNAAACKRLGYGLDELQGKFIGCVNPLLDEQRWTEIWRAVKQSKYFTAESLNRSKEGLEFPVEIASTYVALGNREFMCGFARDITDRRRTQLALHESEKRHRALFHSSRDAMMILVPPSWQFCSGNPAAIALFGARDELDFIARAPWEYSPERQLDGRDSKEKALEMIDSAIRDGTTFFEWTHRRASGDDFPATVLLTRIDLNGVTMLQATVRDESERKRLQASMAQSDRLASMGMLAAGVAHEINNPLAYVRYNIESLSQDIPKLAGALQLATSTIRRQLGEAAYAEIFGVDADLLEPAALKDAVERSQESLEGIERIVAITRGLSTFSRVEQVNRAKVDVSVAIEAAINMAHNELSHRARLVRDVGPMPNVFASEGKLSQVFLNLLVNAAHAIDEGNVLNNQITVRAWTEGDQICIEITDTGKGIAAENLQKIFEPFYTTKGVGLGSGLGLSISSNILAEFNGSLSVKSELGAGSSFLVCLPVLAEKPAELGPVTADLSPDRKSARGRILVVEDEAAINRSLVRLFGNDHEVVSVSSGKEAQELILADPNFDLILCDLMMARMSGIEFHAWLATHDRTLANQLVFITGGAFTPKARAYLASVGNLTVEKPFDAKALKRQVSEMIQTGKSGL